jgi:hypothetical protein
MPLIAQAADRQQKIEEIVAELRELEFGLETCKYDNSRPIRRKN